MIFAPTDARAELYRRLLTDTLLVRSQTPTGERGHSLLYAAADAIVRDRVEDEEIYQEALAFRDQMRALLNLAGPPSILLEDGNNEAVTEAVRAMWATGRYRTILFEGYVAHSAREHAPFFAVLDAEFTARGAIVLRADGPTADRFNDKTRFIDFMRGLHGPESVPPGELVPVAPLDGVIAASRSQLALSGTAILKVAGMGGSGNLVIKIGDDSIVEHVSSFLAANAHADHVRVEAWQPWLHSYACSYFVTETGVHVPLEVCAQMLSAATAGYIGSTSVTGLSQGDREAVQALADPFISHCAANGSRGFLGVDVILSAPTGRPGECLLRDSGLAVRFIEANMRVNSHNQDRVFIAELAARHGLDMDRLDHAKIGVLIRGSRNRKEAVEMVDRELAGLSTPLSAVLDRDGLAHVVIECHGEQRAYRNDFVFFVAQDAKPGRFDEAVARLTARGWLKT